MPRLPSWLEPAFPVVKRVHRFATRTTGSVTRPVAARRPGGRMVPFRGADTSEQTLALDPEHVRIHRGGPSEHVVRQMPVGLPADHWIWPPFLEAHFKERSTLEITDGVVIGNYAAHLTPGGILDYETSPYFGVKGWHEHPIYLRPRLPEIEHVDGTLLTMAAPGSGVNYYHVVMDMLERYAVFSESMPGVRPDAILANRNTGYARQYLSLLGLDDIRTIEPVKHVALQADRLLAPSLHNGELLSPPWTQAWLRERLPAKEVSGRPQRLYVTRGDRKNSRRLVNEAEVLQILRPLGFEVFDPGQHSVQDQIDSFAAAEVVVAPHGAALTNVMFASPGVRVLEMFSPHYINPAFWSITSNVPESTYRYLLGETSRPVKPGTHLNSVFADVTVDLAKFRGLLDDLMR